LIINYIDKVESQLLRLIDYQAFRKPVENQL
jgi:hypothetical protein